jgi:putative ABC transport system ATP-binding protein
MQLTLEQLIPIPLRERIERSTSDVWGQSLVFQQPEYVFIQAPSGTGKTTLAHFLYGLRDDHTGSVVWDRDKVSKLDAEQLAILRSKDVSIIFQDLRLFPELTAWENLEIKRSLTNSVAEKTVLDWMERLGVSFRKDALASTLSYGEGQRVAIIRALLQPFKWLVMDEPFSHLDNDNIAKAAALIHEVVKANSAGLVLADLEDNDLFPYTRKLKL